MTSNKKLKRAIRARAEASVISYTTARLSMGVESRACPVALQGPTSERDDERISRIKAAAMQFPLSRVISRYRKEFGVSEEDAKVHERELRRYLCIAAIYHDEPWPMLRSLDHLWHTFILFTKEYQKFCNSLGVPLIHHEPHDDNAEPEGLGENYARFLDYYVSEFGSPPEDIWPISVEDGSDCFSCEQACEGNCAGSG
jgi:hypothetical protein